jgi:hypothetical protein
MLRVKESQMSTLVYREADTANGLRQAYVNFIFSAIFKKDGKTWKDTFVLFLYRHHAKTSTATYK